MKRLSFRTYTRVHFLSTCLCMCWLIWTKLLHLLCLQFYWKENAFVMHNSLQFLKYFADCFIMGSRLVLILDDLLWVLTDSQLKAALHFLDSLTGLVQKATELTRIKKAARKLEVVLIVFHFTDYLMRSVNYLLAILLCVFWSWCRVGILIVGNEHFTHMRENKFCHYINADYILLEIMAAVPSAVYSIYSFVKFQVSFSMPTCGLVYVYWLVDKQAACILWIILIFGLPQRMRQQAPPKCQKLYTCLHSDDIFQKVWIFIYTTVRTAVLLKIKDFGYMISLGELFLMFWRIVVPASASI